MKSSELPPFDFCYPLPDRRLTSKYRDRYFYIFHDKVALIKTSFGCPFTYNFCFCREITRGTYHERPLEEVMEELKYIREKNIYIVDDDFLTSRTRVKRFIDANLDGNLQKNYLLYGRADFIAANPDLMAEFRTAGLRTVIVGIESFNDHELQNYNKNITAKTNEDALNILKSNKIDCYATVIVPPTWGKEDFAGCLKKIKKLGIHYVNLQPFTPLPGTGMKTAGDDLIIPYHDFAKWDLAHVTIRPEKMSVAEFYRNILRMYRSILFQPIVMLNYLRHYNAPMLLKMMKGSFRVWRQYRSKIKESKSYA